MQACSRRTTSQRRASGGFTLALVLLTATALPAQTDATAVAAGRKALDLLLAGRYDDFGQVLTANAKEKLTPDFLRTTVDAEIKGFGKAEQISEPVVLKTGNTILVSFPVKFSANTVNVQFSLNDLGHVAGMYFRPANSPLPATWKQPPYSRPESFHEREIILGEDTWKLPGTLTAPAGKGPFPAVVLVHGPGPNDRNEGLMATRMFEDIAEGLSSRGYVVIRYDKRTKVYGERMSALAFTIQQETVEDALRAIALARKQPEVDPRHVYVLGHSLGGYIAPRIAVQDGKLAGIILLAGNTRRIEDMSLAQTEFMLQAKGGPTPQERERFEHMKEEAAQVKALQPKKDNPEVLLGLPVEYFLDLKTYEPVAEAKRAGIPMLILQGERDFQVTMDDFKTWRAGLSGTRYEFRTYPGLNHLFIAGEGAPSPAEYRKPGNVAAEAIGDMAGWLAAHR